MPSLVVEYAKSGRSKCSLTACGKKIDKHEVRIGTVVTLPFGDDGAESTKWRHVCCFTDRQIKNGEASGDLNSIAGLDMLADADKDLIEKMKRGELVGKTEVIGRIGDVMNSPMAQELMGKAKKPAPKKKAAKTTELSQAASSAAAANDQDDVDSQATDEYDVSVEEVKEKPLCPYGENCFRTSADHFAQYAHDGDEVVEAKTARRKPVIVGKKRLVR